ncbi:MULTISPECIES: flagellar biosynthetic protein FliQ [unclassified Elioraea]|uniref:flagellar biosynthetic protein FliQ n=1 Tax=unclassified Elioraea TaxID=2619524 RepID=UPI00114F26CA|nr:MULTISPECIES: flagellar biosynthetic protein FliQ [unclassified Elioraea]TQF81295.1 flagellar type III secretion system protein FliQ [Elioraea sp. Yellowstone]GIX08995.1 MAG: flagellar biosynthesis protein FliQ [Elioraea sp.]
MTESDVVALMREGLWITLLVGGPLMLTALVVGLLVSLVQALTQVNEASLIFVPKLLAVAGAAALSAPFIGRTLGQFSHLLFDRIVAVGGG